MEKRKGVDQVNIEVDEFEWDDENEEHCLEHRLTPEIAEEVRTIFPKVFKNKGKTGTHQMIGPTLGGNYWTLIIRPIFKGKWKVITAWPSVPVEVTRYRSDRRRRP